MYDVIIIGAGPAGVSAGLYTKRANLNTLIIYNKTSELQKADKIENYYGFAEGISGSDLYQTGIKQADRLGVELVNEEVTKIEHGDKGFKVVTSKEEYLTKIVILATGNKKNSPKIKGIEEFEGRGVSYCAICDGFFYRNKDVAVLGNGNYAISETNDLINITNKISILTNGGEAPEFRADNVDVISKEIREVRGTDKVEEIEFEDNSVLKTDGIFIAEGIAGSTEFAKKLGILVEKNRIIVNENMETNIKGIYACGDCTGGLLQISKAVYEGAKAGLQAIKYFKQIKEV